MHTERVVEVEHRWITMAQSRAGAMPIVGADSTVQFAVLQTRQLISTSRGRIVPTAWRDVPMVSAQPATATGSQL